MEYREVALSTLQMNDIVLAGPGEQGKAILNYAILNGALEPLPESLVSVAIISRQMKMVKRIRKTRGIEFDKVHIKYFLATAGVGMALRYVGQIGVKLLGEAKNMQGQYLPATREKARTVNVSQILEEVRQ